MQKAAAREGGKWYGEIESVLECWWTNREGNLVFTIHPSNQNREGILAYGIKNGLTLVGDPQPGTTQAKNATLMRAYHPDGMECCPCNASHKSPTGGAH